MVSAREGSRISEDRIASLERGFQVKILNLNEHALSIRGYLLHLHIILRITIMEIFFVCLREHLWLGGLKLKV